MLFSASRAHSILLLVVSSVGMIAGCGDLVIPQQVVDAGSGGRISGNTGGDLDAGGDFDSSIVSVDEAGSTGGGGEDEPASRVLPNCKVQDAGFGAPDDLACTGLYSDWKALAIAPGVQAFDPGIHLWSDGTDKLRWIFLPPGTQIDTADPNEWRFPVGTKAWKEFKLSGHRVETRFFWKRGPNDWVRTTYRWSDDELQAKSLTGGAIDVGGSSYSIPPVTQCDTCHMGRIDRLLGFEAVSLSTAKATGLNMTSLTAAKLLSNPPSTSIVIPDDVGKTGRTSPALGWLHVNCGVSCHNRSPSGFAGSSNLFLRLEIRADGTLGPFETTDTWKTAVNVDTNLEPYRSQQFKRIFPGNVDKSLIPFRDGRRNDPQIQMPPIATSLVDLEGLKLVKNWITGGTFP